MQGHGVPCLNNAPSNEPENVLMYSPDVARSYILSIFHPDVARPALHLPTRIISIRKIQPFQEHTVVGNDDMNWIQFS